MDDLSVSKRKVADYIAAVGVCCSVTLAVIFIVLGIRDSISSFTTLYIQDLYVPSLNKTTTFNTSVFIDLKFERAAASTSVGYAYFQMTLFYGESRRLPVAHRMVEGFSMGRRKTVHVKTAVEAPGLPWEEASRAVSGGSEVEFMVELVVIGRSETCVIFRKNCSWSSEEQPKVVAARVAVDASGHKVSKNPIELECIGYLRY